MSDNNDLLTRIVKDPNKLDEIEIILGSHFKHGAQIAPDKIRWGDQIDVVYAKGGGNVLDIKWAGDARPEEIDSLEAKLDESVFSDHGLIVSARYVFTCPAVEGALQVGDDFQLIPPSDNAPQPDVLYADHPAILAFSHANSPNHLIKSHRAEKRLRELHYLLNVLLRGPIKRIPDYSHHTWVWESIHDPENPEFSWRQIGYAPPIRWERCDDTGFYANSAWPEIPRRESVEYYSRVAGIRVGEPFELPDSFEVSIGCYFALADQERDIFRRSGYWFAKSLEVYHSSLSLAYLSLVSAIEALLPPPKSMGKCETCGKDQFEKSISERVQEFLEEYGADLPKSNVREFYRLRSKFAHGGGLMPRDREVTGFRFSSDNLEKEETFNRLHRTCEIMLINWLHSEKRLRAAQ